MIVSVLFIAVCANGANDNRQRYGELPCGIELGNGRNLGRFDNG
ncbi:MAG: hypothetical protein WAW41_16120 [Methylobacter sp.]